MTNCAKCGAQVSLPYTCRRCQKQYCAKHRLPESHDCIGLQEKQKEGSRDAVYEDAVSVTPVRENENPDLHQDALDPEFNVKYSYTDETSTGREYAFRRNRSRFSRIEVANLLIALGLLALLSLSSFVGFPFLSFAYFDLSEFTLLTLILFLSFLPHELMHKVTAQRYGLFAEFRIIPYYVLLTLVFILTPFKLYAPGAVMIGGVAKPSEYGKTAAAGPATNLIIGGAMIGLAFIFPYYGLFLLTGAWLSGWLAFFNMFPVQPFDGEKVLHWSRPTFFFLFISSLALFIFARLLYSQF